MQTRDAGQQQSLVLGIGWEARSGVKFDVERIPDDLGVRQFGSELFHRQSTIRCDTKKQRSALGSVARKRSAISSVIHEDSSSTAQSSQIAFPRRRTSPTIPRSEMLRRPTARRAPAPLGGFAFPPRELRETSSENGPSAMPVSTGDTVSEKAQINAALGQLQYAWVRWLPPDHAGGYRESPTGEV